ncbi:hypothetical protein [uncultured Chryseobacterium sp.]|uniref:hypothetical protein n=1 Tax=uncultured Chryseobacterium sp. TaxID=259322 RepID=UPI0037481A8A
MADIIKQELSFDEIFELIKEKNKRAEVETKRLLEYFFLSGELGKEIDRFDYHEMRFEFHKIFYQNGIYTIQDRFLVNKESFNNTLNSITNINSLVIYFSTEEFAKEKALTIVFSFIDNQRNENLFSINDGNVLIRETTLSSTQIIDNFKSTDVYDKIKKLTGLENITTHIEYKASDISSIAGDGNFEMNIVCVNNRMEQKHTVFNGKSGRLTIATFIQSDVTSTKSGYYDFGNMRP